MRVSTDEAFEIELRSSGEVLTVPGDRTALSVLFEARAGLDSNCLRGECGACVQTVLAGTPDHRDTVLSPRARAAGKRFIPCVSRAAGRLVLDL
ncbi:ferredoxin-like protein [Gordonia polyisoprenivorans VH2]|uniref:Ferredoxin-like protein n=1 Tax=Gordonia polyisoprenivorans (strain DSM 44266 / VH2) TaxID=1112204 RepID=H6MVT4_GORPV|nr:ferredoxin-like protein [Gordonia polyisoprenivorans VH2]